MTSSPQDVTQLMGRAARGEQSAVAHLLPLVYDRLRALANTYFQKERRDHTLEPTALVHEVYVKLIGGEQASWESRAHYFAVAASAMRQVLTDHARRKKAAKRGGDRQQVTLSGLATPVPVASQIDIVALEGALEKLTSVYPEQARVAELRFLGGLEVAEVAHVLGVSQSTVERHWRLGRAWLRRELSGDASP